jgi:hypothetical protein
MSPITTELARAIKRKEPGWGYTPGVCTCPPLVRSQLSHDVGIWVRKDEEGNRESISIDIYKIAITEEAVEYMNDIGRGRHGTRCQLEVYELGDEGYVFKCPSSFKSVVYYRKGDFIVQVSGDSQDIVERFARYALAGLPAS